MNDFWFQDYKLENLLLGKLLPNEYYTVEAQDTLENLLKYFQDKWDLLFKNIESYVDELENFFTNKTTQEPSYRNIEYKLDPLNSNFRAGILPFKDSFPNIFEFRRELRYSLEEITFECAGDTNEAIIVSKFGTKAITMIQTLKKGKYLGTIEAFITMYGEYLPVVVVTDGFRPIAILDPLNMEWNNPDLVKRYSSFPAYPEVIKLKNKIKEFRIIDESSRLYENILFNEENNNSNVLGIYGQLAFARNLGRCQ